jgi:alkaline phosphatase
MTLKKYFQLILVLSFVLAIASVAIAQQAKNVILFIGDGMGPEQVKAGRLYMGESLSFEGFPVQALINTSSAWASVTDSAAAATAMATGQKVMNGVISTNFPGNTKDLQTILEQKKAQGKSVGLVTSTYITHATPAAFAAHVLNRNNNSGIARDMLEDALPEVLMGGSKYLTPAMAKRAGYYVVTDKKELLEKEAASAIFLAGLFGEGNMPYESEGLEYLPHLSEMTKVALESLANNSEGFFLMVEGGRIDHAGHRNNIENLVKEVAEFSRSVEAALEWAASNPDTLIIVTADHETGGLKITKDNGPAVAPEVIWKTKKHTATLVPLYARGPGAENIKPQMHNTEIYGILAGHAN